MEESMIGKKVRYRDETWEVVHVTEDRRAVIVRIGVDVKIGAIRVEPVAVMVDLDEIEEIPHELTAKEYAEKLKVVLGYDNCKNIDGADPEDEVCAGLDLCEKCPFYLENREAVFEGSCEALMLYHPDLAMKLMDEWQAEKNKPKGKTYLQDFVEKLPRTAIGQGGIPFVCLKNVYGEEASADDVCKAGDCKKCWGQKMPEEDNAEG